MRFVNDDTVKCFYIVIAEDDTRLVRHTQAAALTEAERLCKKEGKRFYVARAKYMVQPVNVECVQIDTQFPYPTFTASGTGNLTAKISEHPTD